MNDDLENFAAISEAKQKVGVWSESRPTTLLLPNNNMDPHHLLPEESFLDLFQASDPSEIANASSVSHDWRSSIQKASTLHRVIDLTMREDQTAKFLLNHLERFSKLSLAKLEVVKIDFSPFWNELKEWDPRFPDYSACSELFNLFTLSRKTLKVLKLMMRSNDRLSLLDNHSNLDKLISFLSDKDAFPSLEHIELEIPSLSRQVVARHLITFQLEAVKFPFGPREAHEWQFLDPRNHWSHWKRSWRLWH